MPLPVAIQKASLLRSERSNDAGGSPGAGGRLAAKRLRDVSVSSARLKRASRNISAYSAARRWKQRRTTGSRLPAFIAG